MKKILIIDDDTSMCTLLSKFLRKHGYETDVAFNGIEGISKFKKSNFDTVLCDYRLGDMNGKEVLFEITKYKPGTIFLIVTGYSDIRTAIDIIKFGAYDYICKPVIPDEILSILASALDDSPEKNNNRKTGSKNKNAKIFQTGTDIFIGKDPSTKVLYQQMALVAPTNYSVILYGESGTGKEVIAKAIHETSERRSKPFIAMDCGTLNKELSGSELFGHVKGSFTGAVNDKAGHFELAKGGTLFLDEIANLSIEVQATLLRVIQEKKFRRVGSNNEIGADVRIIVASNENLQSSYKKGKFREDLYHRLNEFSINLTPLRKRIKDIEPLAIFFLEKVNRELGKKIESYDDDVIDLFKNYKWQGNIRELKNVIRRAVLLSEDKNVSLGTLPNEIRSHSMINDMRIVETLSGSSDLDKASLDAEYKLIQSLMIKNNFNKSKTAKILKINRKTLHNKLKEHAKLSC